MDLRESLATSLGIEEAPVSAETPPRFRVLMERALEGCSLAAQELQQRYANYIVRAVRRRLPRALRSSFDSVDFVQDVWASFYRAQEHEFESPEHLIAFLTRVAHNKVIDAARDRLLSRKRDASREEPLAHLDLGQEGQKVFAREATPSQTAISRELWTKMLAGQPPAYRQVLVLLREGRTQADVAGALRLNRKTVQRIVQRALEKIRK
jgi:RNA polymerase sigma-70 factor (ECF subfamily)